MTVSHDSFLEKEWCFPDILPADKAAREPVIPRGMGRLKGPGGQLSSSVLSTFSLSTTMSL